MDDARTDDMDDPQTDDTSPEPQDGDRRTQDDEGALDPEPLAVDADDVREFAERMIDEPAAPMTQEGVINNP